MLHHFDNLDISSVLNNVEFTFSICKHNILFAKFSFDSENDTKQC